MFKQRFASFLKYNNRTCIQILHKCINIHNLMIGRYVEADYEEDYENFFSRGRNVDLTFSRSFDKENENENTR